MLQVVYTNISTALSRVSFIEYEKQLKKIEPVYIWKPTKPWLLRTLQICIVVADYLPVTRSNKIHYQYI